MSQNCKVVVKRQNNIIDELIHSDIYLGEEYYDGLIHKKYKYIDKEFKNGKWVYYYGDYKDYYNPKKASRRQREEQAKYDKFAKENTKKTDRLVKGSSTYDKSTNTTKHEATYYTDDLFGSTKRSYQLGVDGHTSIKIKKIGKVGQAYIKGKAKLNKTVKQAKKQINKGKKYISKLFG